jgi:hypothetical protein
MQETTCYIIDLTEIRGNGNIKCPKCGTGISPDDTSEEVYTILEPVIKENHLQRIILRCNKCRSTINLTGFNTLNKKLNT